MNWDVRTKNTISSSSNYFFKWRLHNFFTCVPKYLAIAQFLPNPCLTFPIRVWQKKYLKLFYKDKKILLIMFKRPVLTLFQKAWAGSSRKWTKHSISFHSIYFLSFLAFQIKLFDILTSKSVPLYQESTDKKVW